MTECAVPCTEKHCFAFGLLAGVFPRLPVMVFTSLSPVARLGAKTGGSKSHCVCLSPSPVCDILPLCCKTIFFITSIAISLSSLCIKNYYYFQG